MARIWLDALTPKQARLCCFLYEGLKEEGHEVFVTARRHAETLGVLELELTPHKAIGSHGGPSKLGKLVSYAKRAGELASFIHGKNPNVLISLSSPSAVRVAFGLGIPCISLNDTPHAVHVGRLALPLSTKIISPKAIPIHELLRLGAEEHSIVQYEGVDEVMWVVNHQPNPSIVERLDLREDKPLVILRPPEWQAAYYEGQPGPSYVDLLEALLGEGSEVIMFPRYEDQAALAERFKEIVIPERAIDTLNLYPRASLVISGGGTMAREGALMGTPSISFFAPDYPLYVNDYLEERGFPIWRFRTLQEAFPLMRRILRDPSSFRVDTSPLLAQLEPPTGKINEGIEGILF